MFFFEIVCKFILGYEIIIKLKRPIEFVTASYTNRKNLFKFAKASNVNHNLFYFINAKNKYLIVFFHHYPYIRSIYVL